MGLKYIAALCIMVWIFSGTDQVNAVTLEDVYESRALKCGVATGALNFSSPNTNNEWRGMEVELCRALALMIFGTTDEQYLEFIPLTSNERIDAVTTGRVHILAAQQPWTWLLSANNDLEMIGPYFYDGQGLMAHTDSNIRSVWNIQGKQICLVSGSDDELRMRRLLKRLRYSTELVLYDDNSAMFRGFEAKNCDAMSTRVTSLFDLRRTLARPETTTILPQLLSKRPLGLIVSAEHREWVLLVQLLFDGLVYADELGLHSKNIDKAETSGSEDIITFINFGNNELFDPLTSENWVTQVIGAFGSYEEIYLKYFGPQSVTPFPQGVHRNWSVGGLVYGDPIY